MQSLSYRKKTSPFKTYRNDPGRFFGDGVMFKAKLIGILEVGEARGDKMCQEALQDLKMAIRAAGEHKQRITIHVTIDGLRLRDEKTNDSLFHHPVHKISFIAQDMSDSRAFGYIFGSPDSGHRFFGIKTDKAASLVVLAMRDLFQVVFELKKKEIELARQQINGSSGTISGLPSSRGVVGMEMGALGGAHASVSTSAVSSSSSSAVAAQLLALKTGGSALLNDGSTAVGQSYGGRSSTALPNEASTSKGVKNNNGRLHSMAAMMEQLHKERSPDSVADLVDLEQELSSIQRGITQMERITPNEPPMKTNASNTNSNAAASAADSAAAAAAQSAGASAGGADPFGDSFTQFPTYNLLPPPESAKSRHSRPLRPPDDMHASGVASPSASPTNVQPPSTSIGPKPNALISSSNANVPSASNVAQESWPQLRRSSGSPQNSQQQQQQLCARHSADKDKKPINTTAVQPNSTTSNATAAPDATGPLPSSQSNNNASTNQFRDAFTDLDPLGTGKSKPYIDKKYFFQDLKNPPKKVLRDLSETESAFSANFPTTSAAAAASAATGYDSQPSSLDDARCNNEDADAVRRRSQADRSGSDFSAEISGVNFAPNFPEPESIAATAAAAGSSATSESHGYYAAAPSNAPDLVASGIIGNNKALLVTDNDPFSPRMRKFDLFDDDFGRQPAAAAHSAGDSFEFGFTGAVPRSTTTNDQQRIKISAKSSGAGHNTDFTGAALQVNLPPEQPTAHHSFGGRYGHEAAAPSETPTGGYSASTGPRSRSAINSSSSSSSASVFRHNTAVDTMMSSLSSAKKQMKPHLFSSQKYSRRSGSGGTAGGGSSSGGIGGISGSIHISVHGGGDSNTINMRRLQESDSMSENETSAQEHLHATSPPPPPPPLPPKKQFGDLVIRPRAASPLAAAAATDAFEDSFRYGSSSAYGRQSQKQQQPQQSQAELSPALPLPARKVGRLPSASDPAPLRPAKKLSGSVAGAQQQHQHDQQPMSSNFGEDYMQPIGGATGDAAPILLPPPHRPGSTKNRGRRQPEPTDQSTAEPAVVKSVKLLPDITLNELMTLGLDELASKLNVPVDKLSTMNIVELTQYLADYVEKSSQNSLPMADSGDVASEPPAQQQQQQQNQKEYEVHEKNRQQLFKESKPEAAIFKVSFDNDNEATFIAKFDDNFGEDVVATGAASSAKLPNFANFTNVPPNITTTAAPPSADRYAVFREIIEAEHDGAGASTTAATSVYDNEDDDDYYYNQNDSSVEGSDGGGGRADSGGPNIDSNFAVPSGVQQQPHALAAGTAEAAPAPPPVMQRIDTNITQMIAQAKDRYAALRDIIMVEDLFDKTSTAQSAGGFVQSFNGSTKTEASGEDLETGTMETVSGSETVAGLTDVAANDSDTKASRADNAAAMTMPEINVSALGTSPKRAASDSDGPADAAAIAATAGAGVVLPETLTTVSSKDDLEINEYMNRAISNLSLESRDHLSPLGRLSRGSGTASGQHQQQQHNAATSPMRQTLLSVGDSGAVISTTTGRSLSNASTSPIQLQQLSKSPMARSPIEPLAPVVLTPTSRSPLPQSRLSSTGGGGERTHKQSLNSAGSLSDVVLCASSPDADRNMDQAATSESWAVFESADDPIDYPKAPKVKNDTKSKHTDYTTAARAAADSPGSSDEQQLSNEQRRWRRLSAERDYAQQQQPPTQLRHPDTHYQKPHGAKRSGTGWPAGGRAGHTSSSSRDLSPWDDDAPTLPPPPSASVAAADLRRRTGGLPPPSPAAAAAAAHASQQHQHAPDRHGFYMRHARRMHSSAADDEYDDYEDDDGGIPRAKHQQQLQQQHHHLPPHPPHSQHYHHHRRSATESRHRSSSSTPAAVPALTTAGAGSKNCTTALGRSRERFGDDDDDDVAAAAAPVESPSGPASVTGGPAAWYHASTAQHGRNMPAGKTGSRYSWSPEDYDEDYEDDEDSAARNGGRNGGRSFERSAYERSTYGPPYEKRAGGETAAYEARREAASAAAVSSSAARRRYYRGVSDHGYHPAHGRHSSEYDYDNGGGGSYERRERTATAPGGGGRGPQHHQRVGKGGEQLYYEQRSERRSFDCESNDSSFDYGGVQQRRRSYGSGDVYGSMDSRESDAMRGDRRPAAYGDESMNAYRSLRQPPKKERFYENYMQYSDGEVVVVTSADRSGAPAGSPAGVYGRGGRGGELDGSASTMVGDTRSLQRPVGRTRKSSGSSPWDGEELTPTSQKSWKRPGSAAESELKLSELGRSGSQPQQCSVQGSDGEKDRRFRKKIRSRGKETDRGPGNYASASMRQTTAHHHRSAEFGGYDRPEYDTNESPLAGGGYRGSRRRLDSAMSSRTTSGGAGTYDRRLARGQQQQQQPLPPHQLDYDSPEAHPQKQFVGRGSSRSITDDLHQFETKFEQFEDDDSGSLHHAAPLPLQPLQQPPLQPPPSHSGSAISRSESNKFSTYDDEQGFESDFNSPSSGGAAAVAKSLRFSNDFSASQNAAHQQQHQQHGIQRNVPATASLTTMSHKLITPLSATAPLVDHNSSTNAEEATPPSSANAPRQTPTPKLRFDECVTVVGSGNNAAELFEDDDFGKAEFSFEATDQWNAQLSQQPKRALKGNAAATSNDRIGAASGAGGAAQHQRRQQQLSDNIRKSESVNIFAKKQEDPFEDDDFFKVSSSGAEMPANNGRQQQQQQQQSAFGAKWDNDFAKFDENI